MSDNRLLTELLSTKHLTTALYAYTLYTQAADIYRRTKAVMRSVPTAASQSASAKSIKVENVVYPSSKIYTFR